VEVFAFAEHPAKGKYTFSSFFLLATAKLSAKTGCVLCALRGSIIFLFFLNHKGHKLRQTDLYKFEIRNRRKFEIVNRKRVALIKFL
jgi:hypothetical protein